MKRFLLKVSLFFSVFIIAILLAFFLPTTPKAKKHYLFSKVQKDTLLRSMQSPRVIVIGGSSVAFGLNGEMIKQQLGLNTINTGIHAAIGLIYMLDSTLTFIKNGDIVVVAPEYNQFYGNLAYGREELLKVFMDTPSPDSSGLRIKQWMNIVKYLPKYIYSKFKADEYRIPKEHDVYNVNKFDKYGDLCSHWELEKREFEPYEQISEKINFSVITAICEYQKKIKEKGATLFVTFPPFQIASFKKSEKQINRIEKELRKKDLLILGTPERYKVQDALLFDTPYHLSKKGVDHRTQLLIDDLKGQKEKWYQNKIERQGQ